MVEVVGNGVVGLGGGDEVSRDEPCALVDQLVEGVLPVGAWFAPHDGSCGVLNSAATARHKPRGEEDEISESLFFT